MHMSMRIRFLLVTLVVGFVYLLFSFPNNDEHKYECIVRVTLAWNDDIDDNGRADILLKFSEESLYKSKGKDFFGLILNNHYTLMHIDYSFFPDKCAKKYQETQRIFDTYLKPMQDSPKYSVYTKELKDNEFDDLWAKY